MEQNFINYTLRNNIAILELDDPSANTLTFDLLKELEERLLHIATEPKLAGVILIGKGDKFFSGGVNIGMLLTAGCQHNSHFILYAVEVLELIKLLGIPIVTIINGNITGGGLELALIADYRIAVTGNYNIGFPEVRLGVIPGMGGTQRLSRLVGAQCALEMITQGEFISPEKSLQIGLIDILLPEIDFREEAIKKSQEYIFSQNVSPAQSLESIGYYHQILEQNIVAIDINNGLANISINDGAENYSPSDLLFAINLCLLDVRADEDVYCVLISINSKSFGRPAYQQETGDLLSTYVMDKITGYPRIVALHTRRPLDRLEFELALCCDYRFISSAIANSSQLQKINSSSPHLNRFRTYLPPVDETTSIADLFRTGFFKSDDEPHIWLRRFIPPVGAGQAIGYAKLAVTKGYEENLASGLLLERHLQEQLFAAPDSKEGMRAYLEKRRPYFVGMQHG